MFIVFLLFNVQAQLGYVGQVVEQLNKQNCSKAKYGAEQIHQMSGIYFCDQYARRTCCNQQNFEDLKIKWFREYQQIVEISPECHEAYMKTVCMDCDGDIGQGVKEGLCPHFCNHLYQACQRDLFQYDEKSQKLRFCQNNDVVCSQLSKIVQSGDQFCYALGHRVNTYNNIEEWIENKYLSLPVQSICFDGTPSSKIWNLGLKLPEQKAQSKQNSQKKVEETPLLSRVFIGGIIIIVLGVVVKVLGKY